ncbi:uncharacterized protein Z520_08334 [Fonsecaea multimorphosa CBS 102226]|uniref:F-box domain-containing protein n=1 Tax=Fonsecaea multimorphosa CBS 102226 TaxID=1442371 RepID=A0A0D2JZN8_9EURO|nr:uncharacterized protein Z520_08334 [Fonsecaea multimorphosa CBS 102226]KIX96079.1 hypothetical protein Z520_08334 [Fonsecaea multimorphosa CBS 102226]OAL21845.1 hypothetical protein AYO22_07787 [Fonsecaea multimorphosa]
MELNLPADDVRLAEGGWGFNTVDQLQLMEPFSLLDESHMQRLLRVQRTRATPEEYLRDPREPSPTIPRARINRLPPQQEQQQQHQQPQEYMVNPTPSRPDPYEPFIIPDSILLHSPISPQTQSKFLQLPPELLTHILGLVKIPYFQLSLALTCKTMARVAAQKNVLSPWRGYRDKDGLFRLLERKNNFIPEHLSLCRACFRFLPNSGGEYWDRQMADRIFDLATVNWYDLLAWFHKSSRFGHQCPWCVVLGYSTYMSESTYLVKRAKTMLSIRERMCPDLNRRMDQP